MNENPKDTQISRREFTFSVAVAAAGVALPASLVAQQERPPAETPAPIKPPESSAPKISEAGKREVELKAQWIVDRYGARLSDSQKADVRKALASTQEGLEALRAFPIDNSDEPATVLHFNDPAASTATPPKGARR